MFPKKNAILTLFFLIFLAGLISHANAQFQLLVSNQGDSSVSAFDLDNNGAYLGRFVAPGSGGLSDPRSMALGPDGRLYIASYNQDYILRFNGTTGEFVNTYVDFSGLNGPTGLAFANNGMLFSSALPGNLVGFFTGPGSGNTGTITGGITFPDVQAPNDLAIGPDGNLYVLSLADESVPRNATITKYDPGTGSKIAQAVDLGPGYINNPFYFTFGSDNNIYVSRYAYNDIVKFDGQTGASLGVFASGSGLMQPMGIQQGPDGNIYVVSQSTKSVFLFDGSTGAFISKIVDGVATTTPPAPSGIVNNPVTLTFIPSSANLTPIARTTANQTVLVNSTVTLDGSASFSPYSKPLAYNWIQIAGPTVSLNLSNPAKPIFIAPASAPIGGVTLTFELKVNNGTVDSVNTAVTNVTVKNTNVAPVANAGQDQTVSSGAIVTLDAIGSYDYEGTPLNYFWEQASGPQVELSDMRAAQPTFTAPTTTSGNIVLTFYVSANDGEAITKSSSPVTITVQPNNHPPIANAGTAATYVTKATVRLDGSGSYDPDGDPLTYKWSQTSGPSVSLDLADPVHPAFLAPNVRKLTTLTFSLTVDDTQVDSAPSPVTITVVPEKSAPNCKLAMARPPVVWPPNHHMRKVEIVNVFGRDNRYNTNNPANNNNVMSITGITQDEPTSGLGNGDTDIDGAIRGADAYLRAERNDSGDGRVYRISFKATNKSYNLSCTGSVKVCVPARPGKSGICKDNGQYYDSLQ